VKNPGYRDFLPKKKKIPGTGICRENFSGASRPIKTLSGILMGGALMASLGGGGEFAVLSETQRCIFFLQN
jgi:hypothetical protein